MPILCTYYRSKKSFKFYASMNKRSGAVVKCKEELIIVRNLIKTLISVIIIAALVIVALKLVGFAVRIILPIAILAFIAYVIYLLVTGRRH